MPWPQELASGRPKVENAPLLDNRHGVLKHANTYEIITPESVGATGDLVLGKRSRWLERPLLRPDAAGPELLKAQAAPTPPGAPPERLGGSPSPPERQARLGLRLEESPLSATRHSGKAAYKARLIELGYDDVANNAELLQKLVDGAQASGRRP